VEAKPFVLVEDDLPARFSLSVCLNTFDYTVVEANGVEAEGVGDLSATRKAIFTCLTDVGVIRHEWRVRAGNCSQHAPLRRLHVRLYRPDRRAHGMLARVANFLPQPFTRKRWSQDSGIVVAK